MSGRVLVEQNTATHPVGDVYTGYSLYLVGSAAYDVVLHNRTYDGMKVASKWDSEPVTLRAVTVAGAVAEAREHCTALRRAMAGWS